MELAEPSDDFDAPLLQYDAPLTETEILAADVRSRMGQTISRDCIKMHVFTRRQSRKITYFEDSRIAIAA